MGTKRKTQSQAFSESFQTSETLIDLLCRRALTEPDKRAYTFLADGESEEISFTYSHLDKQARAISASISRVALAGERVLLLYPPGLEYIAAFFGCLYAGVVAVPAYPPDRIRTLIRLQAIAADSEATVALTTLSILDKLSVVCAQSPYLKSLQWLATDTIAADVGNDSREVATDADSLAFFQYTSGSTGTPKGVMLTHGNLLHNAALVYHSCSHTPDERYISWLPTFHDMGLYGGDSATSLRRVPGRVDVTCCLP